MWHFWTNQEVLPQWVFQLRFNSPFATIWVLIFSLFLSKLYKVEWKILSLHPFPLTTFWLIIQQVYYGCASKCLNDAFLYSVLFNNSFSFYTNLLGKPAENIFYRTCDGSVCCCKLLPNTYWLSVFPSPSFPWSFTIPATLKIWIDRI